MKKLIKITFLIFSFIATTTAAFSQYTSERSEKFYADKKAREDFDRMHNQPNAKIQSTGQATESIKADLDDYFAGLKRQKEYWANKEKADNKQYSNDTKIYKTSALQSAALLTDVDSKVIDYSQFVIEVNENIKALTANITDKSTDVQTFENNQVKIYASTRSGVLQGTCTIKFKKNEKISSINCTVINGKLNGLATVIFANGEAENLNFVNGNLYGKCQFQAANGTVLMSCYRNNNSVSGLVKRFYDGNSYANVLYKDNKPVTLLKSYLSDRNYYYPCDEMYSRSYHVYVEDNNIVKRFDDESGSFWSGTPKEDVYNGAGMRGYSNGTLFIGNFKNGSKRGIGSYIYASGDIYTGNFDGAANGLGKLIGNDAGVYEGNFKDNKFHGKGTLTYADASVFTGNYKEGERNGEGRFTKKNGKYMQGRFQKDKNKLKYFDAQNNEISEDRYNADFENGFAKVDYSNKSFYEGNFENGKRQGKGFMTYENATTYDGAWIDNKLHGKGKIIEIGGYVYEGDFANDQKVGYGVEKFANGDTYHGNFLNNQRNGIGIYTWANKNKIEGEFINGNAQGQGTFTWANGEYYKGAISKFLLDGRGKIYDATGFMTFDGLFWEGKRHGNATEYFKNTNEIAVGTYVQGFWKNEVKFSKPSGFYKIAFAKNQIWTTITHYNSGGQIISEEEYNKN